MATASPNLDINSLLSSTMDTVKSLGTSAQQIASKVQDINTVNASQQASALAAKTAAETIDTAKNQEALRQEQVRLSIANRMGTNASEVGWKIGSLADTITEASSRQLAASDRIKQKQSVTFLDNPLQYIVNQLTINADIAEYNDAEQQVAIASNAAQKLESLTQVSIQTNNALTQGTNEATIQASRILSGYQYSKDANQAALEGLRTNLQGIQIAANMGKEQLSLLYEANRAQMQQKQYEVELQRLRIAEEDFNLRKQAAEEKQSEDGLIVKYISRGYFNMTGQQMDSIKAKEAVALFKANAPQFKQYFESGMQSYQVDPSGQTTVISLSPFDASEAYANRMVTNVPPAQKQVLDRLVELRREFNNPAVQAQLNLDKKDKKSIEGAFNTFVEQRLKAEQSSIARDSIFAPLSPEQVISVDPKLASTPVWANVLAPAKQAGIDLSDPNIVTGLITGAMAQGKLSYADALDMQTIWAKGMQLNKMQRNFISMGVTAPTGYITKIDIPLTMGKTNVNLTDPLSWATALNKISANNAIKTQGMLIGNSGYVPPATPPINIRQLESSGGMPGKFTLPDITLPQQGKIIDNTTPRRSPYIYNTTTGGQTMFEPLRENNKTNLDQIPKGYPNNLSSAGVELPEDTLMRMLNLPR